MKHSPFNNLKIYRYFFIAFILLLGILAIYLSCKSKSPTEPSSSLHNQISTQSTNNTTTSSSSTTSVKPGQAPTNTTTLITSRNLTTTSTRTTTTSSSTTTTSRKPTTTIPTTIPTTSVGACYLEWCQVTVKINDGAPIVVQRLDIIDVNPGDVLVIGISVKNSGTAATNAGTYASVDFDCTGPYFFSMNKYKELGTIPADNVCHTWSDAFQMNVLSTVESSVLCMGEIIVYSDELCCLLFTDFGIILKID